MSAVHDLLQHTSVRDLTFEAVAKKAKVGRPTLYRWWPTKAALVLAMFHERMATERKRVATGDSVEDALRTNIAILIRELNGLFGKVVAELIAEGQSEPDILRDLYEQHMKSRRAAAVRDIERAKEAGEFRDDTDPELLIDAIVGPLYSGLLLQRRPLTRRYGDALITQVLSGVKPTR